MAGGCDGTRSGMALGMCEQEARTFSMTEAGVLFLNWTTCSCLPNALLNDEQPAVRTSAAAAAAAIGRRPGRRRACTAASIGRPRGRQATERARTRPARYG